MPRFTIELPEAPKGGRYVLEMEQERPAAEAPSGPTGMREKQAAFEQPSAFDRLLAMIPSDTPVVGANANIRGSKAGGYLMGAADIPVGTAQLVANLAGAGDVVNPAIQAKEQQYQDARVSAGRDGFDAMRLAGNVAGPAAMIPGRLPVGGGVVRQGAAAGFLGGLLQPVVDGGDSYATDKVVQAAVGTAGGAVGAKVFDKLASGLSSLVAKMRKSGRAFDPAAVDAQVKFSLQKEGIDAEAIPKNILESVRKDVAAALESGKSLDPAALARKLDFEALGMQGTTGQITRNPVQFARERNLSGVQDAGEALATVFNQQPRQLAGKLDELGASVADDADAGSLLAMLRAKDEMAKGAVNAAYQSARDSTGRYADVNAGAFSQAANKALDEQMLGRFLPERVRGLLNDVSDGTLPLNVNNLVQVDGVLSDAQRAATRSGDSAAAKAIGVVRTALNQAPIDDAAGAAAKGAFDTARGMARDRFSKIDGVPALKAAIDDVAPGKFIDKFILRADARDVSALKSFIQDSPEASQMIRNQVVSHLKNKAFGANAAGDKAFAQEAFNRELKRIGKDKLSMIFTPEELQTLQAVGRVGAYVSSQPAGAVVNNSGTAAAVMNLLSRIGKVPFLREFGVKPIENALARKEAAAAASGAVPVEPIPFVSPAVEGLRNRLSSPFAFGAGAGLAPRREK